MLLEFCSPLTILSAFQTLPFDIPQIDIIFFSLCFYQNLDNVSKLYQNLDLFTQIDFILELKLLSRVKSEE